MDDILSRPAPTADHRISYGTNSSQFGDLWLPPVTGKSLLPLVVFFHGGWWKSEYDLGYASHLCADLKQNGIATWSIEYRRVGRTGGCYPATFQDAAAGFDFAATLAKSYPLDLSRVITMGHSAGGHLAFWVAGRHHIDLGSEIYQPRPQVALRVRCRSGWSGRSSPYHRPIRLLHIRSRQTGGIRTDGGPSFGRS